MWFRNPCGFPRLFKYVHEVKLFFKYTKLLFTFYCVDIYIDNAKHVLQKTAGDLAQIKTVALNCTDSHYIYVSMTLHLLGKELPVSLKNIVNEGG